MNEKKDGSQQMYRTVRQFTLPALAVLVAAAALSSTAGTARAELRLCNKTPVQVGIAIGYKDQQDWVSEGWWNVDAESCQVVVDGPLPSRFYYLYALDYEEGGAWGGTAFMCTHDKEFTIEGTSDCVARGFERRGFVEVDTGDKLSWTVQLTERPKAGIGGQ
ncbi:DUF1036 domain-containing protein [Acuticoccus sp. MNP-M23]|uniref:DUF1036 domain-containing protein n=1 Tax=Acuticoccus sp. MNP-M23 TaxID=3072793 RepID=UPI002815C912|nr:DUF1036 domain-containing protein [Acuticoccus sp. MNP-M23]WMS44271.1 DUF1036 domain-containing protein [Acuticoccus sp. MNP-M23]